MLALIVFVHLGLIVGVVLLVLALKDKHEQSKKAKALPDNTLASQNAPATRRQVTPEQLVYEALSNVLQNFTYVVAQVVNSDPIQHVAPAAFDKITSHDEADPPNCATCGEKRDPSFAFCLKCGHTD